MNFITAIIRKWTATSLVMRIFIGLLCGAFLGIVVPEWSGVAIFGQIFVSLLKAIAPVLVAILVISSISKARGHWDHAFGLWCASMCSAPSLRR